MVGNVQSINLKLLRPAVTTFHYIFYDVNSVWSKSNYERYKLTIFNMNLLGYAVYMMCFGNSETLSQEEGRPGCFLSRPVILNDD